MVTAKEEEKGASIANIINDCGKKEHREILVPSIWSDKSGDKRRLCWRGSFERA